MPRSIDLNVDAGEGFGAWTIGDDAALFAVVPTASLACGFHAGDPGTMRASLAAALAAGVAVGAHPGLPDLVGFGRRSMQLTPDQVHDDTLYQIGALAAFVHAAGARLHHVKPHGALNTGTCELSDAHSDALIAAVRAFDPTLPMIAVAGSRLARACARLGHPLVAEGFPDRGYMADGSLARRGTPGALVHDAGLAGRRAVELAVEGRITSVDGATVEVDVQSLCIHGDNPGSVATAAAVRRALEAAGVGVATF